MQAAHADGPMTIVLPRKEKLNTMMKSPNPGTQITEHMKYSFSLVLLFLLMGQLAIAGAEITGQVSAVGDGQVLTRIAPVSAGQPYPQAGDQVRLSVQIPGLDEPVDAGSGSVIRVDNNTVTIRVVKDNVPIGARAIIKATGNFSASPSISGKPVKPGVPVSGRTVKNGQSRSADVGSRPIPNVIGLNVNEAKTELRRVFALASVIKGKSTRLPGQAGLVYMQSPKPGTPSRRMQSVVITIYVDEETERRIRRCKRDWLLAPKRTQYSCDK